MILISDNKEQHIIDDIMSHFDKKTVEPGEKLPSENELVNKYRVTRMTVRNALTKLEERGYIYSKQGKGRYFKGKTIQIQLHLTGKTSFTDKMKELGYELNTRNIYCEKIGYDANIFEILNVNEEDAVYKIGRIRYINGEPIAIHNSFVSEERFPSIEKDGPDIESIFSYYRKHGYSNFASSNTLLSITFPTYFEKQLLSCKSMVPLIVVEGNCIDTDTKKVLEHTKVLYRSDKFKYDISMD